MTGVEESWGDGWSGGSSTPWQFITPPVAPYLVKRFRSLRVTAEASVHQHFGGLSHLNPNRCKIGLGLQL